MTYTAQESGLELNCFECHDVHGTTNIFMVNSGNPDSGLTAPRTVDGASNLIDFLFFRSNPPDGSVAFTANSAGSDFATAGAGDKNKICQTCHRNTGHYQNDSDDGHFTSTCTDCHTHDFDADYSATSQDGFMPSGGCNSCHGSVTTGQFWPDGSGGNPGYVDDSPGSATSHANHVLAIGQYLGYGDYNTTMYDDTQQITICAFCHPDPGGNGHSTNVGGTQGTTDLTNRVDIYLDTDDVSPGPYSDVFSKFTGSQTYAPDVNNTVGDQAYNYTDLNCSNLVCHNQNATPTGGAGDWNNPPDWTATINAKCSNTTCHADTTYTISHTTHVHNFQKNYNCTECHVDNGTDLSHQSGLVDINFTNATSLEGDPALGAANGYYNKGGNINPVVSFDYKDGVYNVTCNLVYCHGGDNSWDGTDTTPVWDDFNTATCTTGTCHGSYGSPYSPTAIPQPQITTGNHPAHFQMYDDASQPLEGFGPKFDPHARYGGCSGCHNMTDGNNCLDCHSVQQGLASAPTVPSSTHADGKKDFLNLDNTTVTTLALTDTCDNCHGASVTNAKDPVNWGNSSYKLPCEECHDLTTPANSQRDGLGVSAPAKANYFTAGHGLDTGSTYSPSGRTGAGAACEDCHNEISDHITGATGEDRLDTEGNALCTGCHNGTADGPGGNSEAQVSTHANTSTTMTYVAQESGLELNCFECHDVHGTTNIFMVNSDNPDSGLTAPRTVDGASNLIDFLFFRGLAPGSVAFTANTVGCQTCHTNTGHYQNNSDDGHDTSRCTGCHAHDFDSNYAANSQDGFMPLGCNGCHTFPGLTNEPGTHPLSATHEAHAGVPIGGSNIYDEGYPCTKCHLNYDHNESGVTSGADWDDLVGNDFNAVFVDIRFDGWNPANPPGSVTYNGVPADETQVTSAPGIGGTGTCAGLYCHGSTLNNGGTDQTPEWDDISSGNCGTCHGVYADAVGLGEYPTPDINITSNHHLTHYTSAYGPALTEIHGGRDGCSSCHNSPTSADGCLPCHGPHAAAGAIALGATIPTPTHVNLTVELKDDQQIGPTTACDNCHSTAIVVGGISGAQHGKDNWTNAPFRLDCLTCCFRWDLRNRCPH
jgi:predicted CxxxxCH...CXXCH cytochrome family protein